ncbi:sodium-dependent bicarbonate transport family permease [Roseospira visakhapatnamensis]|uniref:Sodium-dependent bicarbonate transport family permease n=1 Tax=Roseospira visakhapatnamensis TaxID=390880 RepID=A0A7W6REZ3_9PROT|nr:sodium-dependent bicarbonate transport family permease [Roseospira visakhapatnamensis]MBB4267233.1 hypothetical protein [Roseospira visakhapatnamensis]
MTDLLSLAVGNLLSAPVLFFALGLAAGFARSDLTIPDPIAKGLSLYLMLAIGFKGGAVMAEHGLSTLLLATLAAGFVLSAVMPLVAFGCLRATTRLERHDAAAVAAHYGSISLVTFVTATLMLERMGTGAEGFMVATAAVMETPAILVGLWLANRGAVAKGRTDDHGDGDLWREIFLNGSVVVLVGAFFIGWITGPDGKLALAPFIVGPFTGVLCFFLLDMGLVTARRFREARGMSPAVIGFGLYMPVIGAAAGLAAGWLVGLSPGGVALLMVLAASASYIAVPAAMRLALPRANPALYLTLSLGVTFPFNLAIGIPAYHYIALAIAG